jgi:glycosyltransferase involved in cell wall biosynthesis/ADP-heptose:LPS heptosyltransferase
MRVVIDMQGAQTSGSRFRGIGRYSLSLAQAIARNRDGHEVLLALNGLFPEAIDSIRADFDGVLAPGDIRVWHAPGPVSEIDPANRARREAAERIREAFLLDLQPDVVLMTSLFEGLGDDAVTSAGVWADSIPTAVVLYDLIPLISPDIHFRTNPVHQGWYAAKLEALRRCRLLLAISESSRQEALSALEIGADDVVNVWGACDARFEDLGLSDAEKERTRRRAGIDRPFVMYTGGAEEHKNLPRLIEAFALLPAALRATYQLAFVGMMPNEHVDRLREQAAALGLVGEVVFTGYVDDDDLVRLYNSCALFVFPSLHEGLGLPPMEAMACGAPVIVADATSLPEVVGNAEALFDPYSAETIARKLEQALVDTSFRQRLIERGKARSATFSWDESGRRAIRALARFAPAERVTPGALRFERSSRFPTRRSMRILLQKLDHRSDLILAIPAISKIRARYPHATLEALVGSWNEPMARALNLFEQVHVLDFYRPASSDKPALSEAEIDDLAARLGRYDLAIDLRRQPDTRFILTRIDAKRRVGYGTFDRGIDAALDVRLASFTDVPFETTPLNRTHASEQMVRLVDALPAEPGDYIDLPPLGPVRRVESLQVALFPVAESDVTQWSASNFAGLMRRVAAIDAVDRVNLYFGSAGEAESFGLAAGEKIAVHVGLDVRELAASLAGNTVCVANNSFGAHIAGYLGCTVIGVYGGHEAVAQWSPPFGESSVMHAGVPCSPCHIGATAECPFGMTCLASIPLDAVFERVVAACAGELDAPASVQGSEKRSSLQIVDDLLHALAELDGGLGNGHQRVAVAESVSRNHRLMSARRQILVDVSELVRHDARTGIQRVARAILSQLLSEPPEGFTVEPVYASAEPPGYRYARAFRHRFTRDKSGPPQEDPLVDVWAGDIFLGLHLHSLSAQEALLKAWRQRGVRVCFVAYDLLPVLMPEAFPEGIPEGHQRWLESIARFDGVIAISKSVADEFVDWLQHRGPSRLEPLRVGWFHLGADIGKSAPSRGIPVGASRTLAAIAALPSFLMVGTLEPRKGHALVLAAFEALWAAGVEANLVVVGKTGWLVEKLAPKLRSHPRIGKQLFWLESASDEYLERVYAASSALIAASFGEGFGLPLVEAAQHGLPMIVRDIPVFREVAGEHADYFAADSDAAALADHLRRWLDRFAANEHPRSEGMPTITWKQSTQQLLGCLVDDHWPFRWRPDGVRRFRGADNRLYSVVGERRGHAVHSTGKSGHLVFGPHVELAAGTYRLMLWGRATRWSRRDAFDVVHDSGRIEIFRGPLGHLGPGPWRLEVELVLDADVRDLEIRVWVGEEAVASLEGMEIRPRKAKTVKVEAIDYLEAAMS